VPARDSNVPSSTGVEPLALFNNPVGFQALPVRVQLARDLPGTLNLLGAMGYREIELCSFKGFAGDPLRGDFGRLADVKAMEVRRAIADSGMTARSCHFKLAEFEDTRISATLEWAAALGLTYLVITDFQFVSEEWQQTFDRTNACGERLRMDGFQLAIHTTVDIWKRQDGESAFATMLREVEPENCVYQLDLSTTLMNGIDAGQCMESHPGRFFSLHLRDGRKPPEPVRYLPALPLGQGGIDFKRVLVGAKAAGVRSYIVEMTVMPPEDSILAYQKSADFIRCFYQ